MEKEGDKKDSSGRDDQNDDGEDGGDEDPNPAKSKRTQDKAKLKVELETICKEVEELYSQAYNESVKSYEQDKRKAINWRNKMTPETRNELIKKRVSAVCQNITFDGISSKDYRTQAIYKIKEIVSYFKLVSDLNFFFSPKRQFLY